MKPIISQNLLNVLKNKIIPIISLNLFNDVEFLLNNLFVNNGSNHYFNLIYKIKPLLEILLNLLLFLHLKN